ncbi:MAG TPA: ABC transporter ATP-binding protein [Verrucomicrobiae bacterium]|nr:ABC transporter ATP-binding protein [Verrucomicrobiae bacterium]
MIAVKQLSKRFGDLRAVERISFEVAPGELFGFLGPNGAGKTTTISMISGLLRPDEGTVTVGDYNLWESPRQAKALLGLVPQEVALYEEFSARENLAFWGGLYGLPRPVLKKSIDEILGRVGLADRAREPVSRYSGGMKRRLNLAIGLVHRPKVLLLDEPTVGIDPQGRNAILEIIRDIAGEGTTIIFTTHHLEEAEKLCDRVAIMDHGQVLQTGSLRELARVVGDRDVITLRGKFSARQMQQCLGEQPVLVLNVADHLATLHLADGQYGLASLVDRVAKAGIELADLSVQKPTLESVFLKLTGRELRD